MCMFVLCNVYLSNGGIIKLTCQISHYGGIQYCKLLCQNGSWKGPYCGHHPYKANLLGIMRMKYPVLIWALQVLCTEQDVDWCQAVIPQWSSTWTTPSWPGRATWWRTARRCWPGVPSLRPCSMARGRWCAGTGSGPQHCLTVLIPIRQTEALEYQ